MESPHSIADISLAGVKAIAAYIGKTERQTFYLLSTGKLPGCKIGAVWHSTKPKLRARLLGEDGAA